MEVETAKLEFNTLRTKNYKIIIPFREICCGNEDLVDKMVDNTDDTNFIATSLGQLHNTTKHATSMME